MGFFDFDWTYKPVRGIGRLLRGKFKEGLNDIGDAASDVAPAVAWVPGVGPIAAGALGAGGRFLEEATDNDKGINALGVLGSGAAGYGSGKLAGQVGGLSGIGKFLGLGGGGAAPAAAAPAIPAGATGAPGAAGLANSVSTGGGLAPAPTIGRVAASSAAPTAAASPGGLDTLTKLGLASQGAGAAANVYGAHQQGKAEDRRARMEEGEIARRARREEEELARRNAMDPVRAQLLAKLLESLNRPAYA